jgi:hypothetical protein
MNLFLTVDFVASDGAAFPALATAFSCCSAFERRIEMIVSETPNRVNSRWRQACVLLCAMVVLPVGVTYAQDYEAVIKRLRAAVEAGELTREQAGVMLAALKNAGGDKKDQGEDRAKAYLAKVEKELGALVEAGEISRKDAAKRYESAKKAFKERMAAGRGEDRSRGISREDYERAEADLMKLVADGKISEEAARARLEAMRKMMSQQREGATQERPTRERPTRETDMEAIKKRIEGAVESGIMTREEADAVYKGIRERMGERREGDSKDAQPKMPGRGDGAVGLEEQMRKWRNMSEEDRAKLREQAIQRMGR